MITVQAEEDSEPLLENHSTYAVRPQKSVPDAQTASSSMEKDTASRRRAMWRKSTVFPIKWDYTFTFVSNEFCQKIKFYRK